MDRSLTGTSIQDLRQKENNDQYENMRRLQDMQNMQYGAMQNMQYETGHNSAETIHQAQQNPYYSIQTGIEYPQQQQPNLKNTMIDDLAKDINENLGDDTFESMVTETKPQPVSWYNTLPMYVKEGLLLLIIYVFLSLTPVRETFSRYIKYLNPDETGRVSILGILIYGLLLVVLYLLLHHYLL